jgi:hypothetical protein
MLATVLDPTQEPVAADDADSAGWFLVSSLREDGMHCLHLASRMRKRPLLTSPCAHSPAFHRFGVSCAVHICHRATLMVARAHADVELGVHQVLSMAMREAERRPLT